MSKLERWFHYANRHRPAVADDGLRGIRIAVYGALPTGADIANIEKLLSMARNAQSSVPLACRLRRWLKLSREGG